MQFPAGYFNGALLCGVLENMEIDHARRMIADVHRVLSDGACLAAIDQDWEVITKNKSTYEWFVRSNGDKLILQHLQRNVSPHYERDTRYLVNPTGTAAHKLREILKDKNRVPTTLGADDLKPEDINDVWYDESAQFDRQTFKDLAASVGFRDVEVESLPVWSQHILFLKAVK